MSTSDQRLRRIPPRLLALARAMRGGQSDAEAAVWRFVRNRNLGFKFRRQHSVGRFVLDFYCPELRLAIEVDGRQHFEEKGMAQDTARTAALHQQGIRVVRFTNHEVLQEFESVAEAIWLACDRVRA